MAQAFVSQILSQFTGCSMVKLTIASWRHIVQDQMQSMADKCCSHSMNEPPRSAQGQERRIQLNYQKIMTGPPDRTHRLIEIHCLTVRDQTTFLWFYSSLRDLSERMMKLLTPGLDNTRLFIRKSYDRSLKQ